MLYFFLLQQIQTCIHIRRVYKIYTHKHTYVYLSIYVLLYIHDNHDTTYKPLNNFAQHYILYIITFFSSSINNIYAMRYVYIYISTSIMMRKGHQDHHHFLLQRFHNIGK
jgi:hypothetical protein